MSKTIVQIEIPLNEVDASKWALIEEHYHYEWEDLKELFRQKIREEYDRILDEYERM